MVQATAVVGTLSIKKSLKTKIAKNKSKSKSKNRNKNNNNINNNSNGQPWSLHAILSKLNMIDADADANADNDADNNKQQQLRKLLETAGMKQVTKFCLDLGLKCGGNLNERIGRLCALICDCKFNIRKMSTKQLHSTLKLIKSQVVFEELKFG